MLDSYKPNYYPIQTSVNDITFTRCFSELTMNQPTKLSLEQQFSICSFATQVQNMSHDQAKDFLVKLYEQMVVREATYQELLKHQWGLDSGSTMAQSRSTVAVGDLLLLLGSKEEKSWGCRGVNFDNQLRESWRKIQLKKLTNNE